MPGAAVLVDMCYLIYRDPLGGHTCPHFTAEQTKTDMQRLCLFVCLLLGSKVEILLFKLILPYDFTSVCLDYDDIQ